MTAPWMKFADCRDHPEPDLWLVKAPDRPEPTGKNRRAIAICDGCPVFDECDRDAPTDNEAMIWAGLMPAVREGNA